MNNTLEEYFNVNDTLDTLLGGGDDASEIEKVAVAITKFHENESGNTEELEEEEQSSDDDESEDEDSEEEDESSDEEGEEEEEEELDNPKELEALLNQEITNENENEDGGEQITEIRFYFKFFELYNIDRLSKLSSKIKTHYGIDSQDVSRDKSNIKMKLSNSFMDVIYFCFLSSNADSKFWNILFNKRYSEFLEKRFNSSEYNEEFDYEFEDVNNKLYELLFDVKNDREENSYELILEFIHSIKRKRGTGDISLEDFFKLLKTESVYFDRLIKNKLKLLKLRIGEEGTKK